MDNSTDHSWVSVPEFGEWEKRKGVYTRDYSGHFAMMRSVRRYRKKLLSWSSSVGNGEELVDQASKPVKNPENYRHVSDYDAIDNSRRVKNRTCKSLGIGRCLRFFVCCIGR